jgi:hypothetical protein
MQIDFTRQTASGRLQPFPGLCMVVLEFGRPYLPNSGAYIFGQIGGALIRTVLW